MTGFLDTESSHVVALCSVFVALYLGMDNYPRLLNTKPPPPPSSQTGLIKRVKQMGKKGKSYLISF